MVFHQSVSSCDCFNLWRYCKSSPTHTTFKWSFSPECIIMWLCQAITFYVQIQSHIHCIYDGFSPECVIICLFQAMTLYCKSSPTHTTFMKFFARVSHHVTFQDYLKLSKSSPTYTAFKWFFTSSVSSYALLKFTRFSCKSSPTHTTCYEVISPECLIMWLFKAVLLQ